MSKISFAENIDRCWYGALAIAAISAALMVMKISQISNEADAKLQINEKRIVALEAELGILKELTLEHIKAETTQNYDKK
jgi:hypothetical protein